MERRYNRRVFSKTIGFGLGAAMLGPALAEGAPKRRLKIGHTGINWGYRPEDAEQAIKDSAALGYHGFESFGSILEAWEPKGGLGRVLEEAKLPLVSAFCGANVVDPAIRKEAVAKLVRWGQLIKKCGGSIVALNADGVPNKREGYVYNDHKKNIVAGLNEVCKALADIGVVGACTSTPAPRSRQETRSTAFWSRLTPGMSNSVLISGSLPKAAPTRSKVVGDFLELIEHVHLKDWNGGPHWAEYCPLGMGKVDVATVLDLLEKSKIKAMLMVELDYSKDAPMKPLETAQTSKAYLQKQGYEFRS